MQFKLFDRLTDMTVDLSDTIVRIFTITIFWFIAVLVGGIVLGTMPATCSVFELINDEKEISFDKTTFKRAFSYYKKSFKETNKFGFIFVIISLIFIFNLRVLWIQDSVISNILYGITISFLLLWILIILNFFPIYIRYEGTIKDYFIKVILISISQPIQSVLILLWGILIVLTSVILPVIIPFCSIGILFIGINKIIKRGRVISKVDSVRMEMREKKLV